MDVELESIRLFRMSLLVPVVHRCNCFSFLKQSQEDSEDEDKYADDVDMPGQKFETKQRITVRNLRIREDTAKVRTCSAHKIIMLNGLHEE